MQNDKNEYVDLYVPRRCMATNRILGAKDHASIQLALAEVDPKSGLATGQNKTFAILGELRRMGESDDMLTRLAKREHLLSKDYQLKGLSLKKGGE